LEIAQRFTRLPPKQAVISTSALTLLYPQDGIPGYPREEYLGALVDEQEREVRRCLSKGAHVVQIDFTEGRLATRLDPTRRLLRSFVDLNNLVLERFSAEEKRRIGVHTCAGADQGSTHSAGSNYAALLSVLFDLQARNFYVQLASEPDRPSVLKAIREHVKFDQRVFVGVVDVLNPAVESPEAVRDRVLEAAKYIPISQLGTTDDCGFAPFRDDMSRSRETAFAKIRARVLGTQLAAEALGVA
jgi:5-methyltetrahydropteroyltriglutamate--homocysteine methyltransferase